MQPESPDHILADVPVGWGSLPLDRLVDSARGISYGIVQPGSDDPNGVPVLRVNNLRDGRILVDDVMRVSSTLEAKFARTRLQGGEILLSLVGTLGECAVVPSELAGWNVARAVAVIPLKPNIDRKWVVICLRSVAVQELMRAWANTTVQATLNLRDVRRLPILLPPEPDRANFTRAISQLDDKIEQNRRTGRKLEALARATFKAWFVDFEPVKAKAAGQTRFPGMPPATFATLPTRLIDSTLGPVPEGWEVGELGDLLMERGERMTPGEETRQLPYVPIDCITSKRVTLEVFKNGEEAQSSLIRFQAGDILFGAMRPYFHKVCLAPFAGTTRTTCFVLSPRTDNDTAFALMLASEEATVQFATTHSVGSTIPYAKWQNSMREMPCVLPPKKFRKAYQTVADPILQLCNEGVSESAKLSALRDYLLPQLLSGRVRVSLSEENET